MSDSRSSSSQATRYVRPRRLTSTVLVPSAMSTRNSRQQPFEALFRTVDLLVQALRIGARSGELLFQVLVLRAQPLAQRHELRDLRFQRIELGLHARTICQNSSRVK